MPAVKFDISHPGISVYQALTNKELSEEDKAKIIAEAIDTLAKEFPNLRHVATQRQLSETELRLTKEIEETRKEIRELDLRLIKEIEETRKEIKEIDAKLSKEIKELDLKLTKEMEETKREIEKSKFVMLRWQFIFWISQMGALLAIFYKLFGV